jgi:hypothetical protein
MPLGSGVIGGGAIGVGSPEPELWWPLEDWNELAAERTFGDPLLFLSE